MELNNEYDKLDSRVGLLGQKSLLADYSKTLKHLDNVRKGIDHLGISDDAILIEDESEEGEDSGIGKKDVKWIGRQSGRQECGASSGGGIGSGESAVSSPNERDDESSN